ncbi:tRNA threonylcarbamoyladenosine dehydratase [Anoxynatronum buryatiense]|uniref:tRNA A37 threonylcarbamoyladenosine dehydratase n=1 Tax=Anoxynatronum buryatiense TaxID=489973 RepID=A0AA45WXT2_9CLOT|nr:tRNA threonylcarbamoyladenosine dehydratase [Anoxynatronum buryatiense]SMP66038.1 tRNA A37 threonylcarbamoyladenosine dehydratase [Anoxynatronum buryatiense]
MLHAFSRTEMLLGKQGLERLKNSRVAIFGIGGVGTFAVEGLVRSGVGKFMLVDDDQVCLTNLNRQIHATRKTIGKPKVEVMRERILEINPNASVAVFQRFYLAAKPAETQKPADSLAMKPSLPPVENGLTWEEVLAFHQTPGQQIDYIIDAIDTVSAKLDLVVKAQAAGIPVISAMGAGNKLDPTRFEVADIYETVNCPLAKVMRKELRRRGVAALKVVYSQEEPLTPISEETNSCHSSCVCPGGTSRTCTTRRAIPGSVSFVPSVAGLILAGEVIKDLIAS